MDLLGKYELGSLIAEGEVRTLRAREVSTGRQVLVHEITRGRGTTDQSDLAELAARYVRRASPESPSQILEIREHEGTTYIVTQLLPEALALRQWLESELEKQERLSTHRWHPGRAAEAGSGKAFSAETLPFAPAALEQSPLGAAPPASSSPLLPPKSAIPDDSAGKARGAKLDAAGPSEPLSVGATPAPLTPAAREPGAIARRLRAWSPRRQEATGDAAPHRPPPSPAPSQPGKFTRYFARASSRTPKAATPVSSGAPQPKPSSPQPGEFTRYFGRASAGAPRAEKPSPSIATPGHTKEPGLLTRLFQPGGRGGSIRPEQAKDSALSGPPLPSFPPPSTPSDELPRLFATPRGAPGASQEAGATSLPGSPTPDAVPSFQPQSPAQPAVPRATPHGAAGLASGVQPPSPPSPAPRLLEAEAPLQQAQPTRRGEGVHRSYLPLVLILGFVFLSSLALVLYFALKH